MGTVTSKILRFKAGSSSAFGVLFGSFFATVRHHAERLLASGYRGLHKPEDVAQDVFLCLWREVDRRRRRVFDNLRDEASLHLTLALLTRQQVRRARRYDRQAARDAARTVPLQVEAAGITADFLAELEARDALAHLVALLDHPLQQAIVWLLLDGLTGAEVADQLGCVPRTVRRHLLTILDVWRTHPQARRTFDDLGLRPPGEPNPCRPACPPPAGSG